VTAVQYVGQEPMTYPGYTDTGSGKTLSCIPGEFYDVIPASGVQADIPNDGRFLPVAEPAAVQAVTVPEDSTDVMDVPDPPEGGEEA
jgi:hypothetical protein